jgi:DNA-binding response OmpR family regulator
MMPHLRRQPRIFVVDDEHLIASTTAMILSHYGFDAVFFTSPLDALLAARLDAPDLLVSDIVMPQISGILLAIRMQACCPDCRVLLFSGLAGTFDMLEAARTDGHHFELLAKPVHPAVLLLKVQALMERASPLPATFEFQAAL